jgi:hypothetical protein
MSRMTPLISEREAVVGLDDDFLVLVALGELLHLGENSAWGTSSPR